MRGDDGVSRSVTEVQMREIARAAADSAIASYLAGISLVLEELMSRARTRSERLEGSAPGAARSFREDANRFGQILEAVGEVRERRRARFDPLEKFASEGEFCKGEPLGALTDGCDDAPDVDVSPALPRPTARCNCCNHYRFLRGLGDLR